LQLECLRENKQATAVRGSNNFLELSESPLPHGSAVRPLENARANAEPSP